jgi:hypothetical protein
MEPPAKGRRGHTFTYIEYTSVAIFKLSDYINQNTQSICYVYIRRYTDIYIYAYLYVLAILIVSKNYIKANKSIVGWLNGLLVSINTYMLRIY